MFRKKNEDKLKIRSRTLSPGAADLQILERTPENMERLGFQSFKKKEKTNRKRKKKIDSGEKASLVDNKDGTYQAFEPTGGMKNQENASMVRVLAQEPSDPSHVPFTANAGFLSMKGQDRRLRRVESCRSGSGGVLRNSYPPEDVGVSRRFSEAGDSSGLPAYNHYHTVREPRPVWLSGSSSSVSSRSDVLRAQGIKLPRKKTENVMRLMDRNFKFFQSRGNFHIERQGHLSLFSTFYKADLFHTVVNFPIHRTMFIMSILYLGTILGFAILYTTISLSYPECEMNIEDLKDGFYFSIETMTTIGYGTKDIFFGHCWLPLFSITFQAMMDILIECTIFGIIFARMSRAQTRAYTIHFSDKAVITREKGHLQFSFRVCELRKHQLIEAHIRCYAVRHTLDEKGRIVEFFSSKYMRLQNPDDELGGFLLMVMPEHVTHRIDAKSPFMPPLDWMIFRGIRARTNSGAVVNPGVNESENSSSDDPYGSAYSMSPQSLIPNFTMNPMSSNTDSAISGDEGSSLHAEIPDSNPLAKTDRPTRATSERLSHTETSATPSVPFLPRRGRRKSIQSSASPRSGSSYRGKRFDKQTVRLLNNSEQDLIRTYLKDSELEVIVLLEGIDAPTSCTVQARHSYKGDEILWNQEFLPCVDRQQDGSCIVNFTKFHETQEQSNERKYPGFKRQTHKNVVLKKTGSNGSLFRSASYTERGTFPQNFGYPQFHHSQV